MSDDQPQRSESKALWIAGLVVGGLPAALLLLGAAMNLAKPASVVEATTKMGFPETIIQPLGAVLLVSTLLYLIPQTAVLGAILLTGYLGGAVATHTLKSDPWGNILFPAFFGALLWLGLYLRDRRLRELVPLRKL